MKNIKKIRKLIQLGILLISISLSLIHGTIAKEAVKSRPAHDTGTGYFYPLNYRQEGLDLKSSIIISLGLSSSLSIVRRNRKKEENCS
ncbi:MAG TPA: hypothetical protein VN131_04260 [Mobilitalea sp.]|nr:hypothetical protein [Mobilitalea sp.]